MDPQKLQKPPPSPEGREEAVPGGGQRGKRGGRQKSCENCRGRKNKCSRTANCGACAMRGETCIWKGAIPEPETTTCTGDLAIAQAEIGRLKKLVDLLMTRLESPPAPPGRHHPYARSSSKNLPPSGHTVEDAEALLSFASALATSPTETFSYPAQSFPLPPAFPSPDFPFSSPAPSFPSPAPAFSSPATQPSSRTFSHPTFPTPYPIAPLRPQKSLEAKNHAARYDAAIAAFLATKAGEGPLLGGGGGRVEEEEVRGGVEGGVGPMLSDVRSEREEMGEEREEKMELGWEK